MTWQDYARGWLLIIGLWCLVFSFGFGAVFVVGLVLKGIFPTWW